MSLITGVSSHTASTLRTANARFLHTASKEGLRVIASGMERAVRECDAHQGAGRTVKPSKTHRTTHYSTSLLIFWLVLILSSSYDMMPLMCLSSVSLQCSSWMRVCMCVYACVCAILSGFIGASSLSKEDLASRGLSTADVFFSKVTNDIILFRTVLYYTILYSTLLYSTLLYSTLLYSTLLSCTVLYCTVLYCTVLYCTVLYCTVLYCTMLYCTMLYCTVLFVLYCPVLSCPVLYCTVLNCTVLYCPVLSCTVLSCTVLYCTVLYYAVLYCASSMDLIYQTSAW